MLGDIFLGIRDLGVVRRLLFIKTLIPSGTPNASAIIKWFAQGKTSSSPLSEKLFETVSTNLEVLFPNAFHNDATLFMELQDQCLKSGKPWGGTLISTKEKCRLCGGRLEVAKDKASEVTMYNMCYGTFFGMKYPKICAQKCRFVQYYGYYTINGMKFYDDDWEENEYLLSSSVTAIQLKMLRDFDAELLIGIMSYDQKADIYNYVHKYTLSAENNWDCTVTTEGKENRCGGRFSRGLDRRRFEEAHLLYAYLKVVSTYGINKDRSISHSTNSMCESISSPFHEAFVKTWSAHICAVPGCQNCIILDGNAKNHRQVCSVTDAAMEFPGLPGSIKTGCINTPAKGSRFCKTCKDFVCDPKEQRENTQEATACGQGNSDSIEATTPGVPYLIDEILEKKEFRSVTIYKVRRFNDNKECWERAEAIPSRMVARFERGVQRQLKPSITEEHSFGHISKNVELKDEDNGGKTKRRKGDQQLFQTSGFAVEEKNDVLVSHNGEQPREINCNTKKDRNGVRLNAITAGVLAFIRPCNIIVSLNELFGSESKTQVYGHLHNLMSKKEMEKTGFVIYDDACHLRKFARNPSRAQTTPTTKKLASIEILVDRMHMRGHIDPWCKRNCGTGRFRDLDKVNTEVCEQVFSWLSRYKRMTKHMNKERFMFFLLYIAHLHNMREVKLRSLP
ncbi:uncharacterized protein LOC144909414 [Branchiostoma floridae x Branchiostoma belcheri]